jgi:hypothetical protein
MVLVMNIKMVQTACTVDGLILEENFELVQPGHIPSDWWSYRYYADDCFAEAWVVEESGDNNVLSLSSGWASVAGPTDLVLLDYAVEADAHMMYRDDCVPSTGTQGAKIYLRATTINTAHVRGGYIINFDPEPDNRVFVQIMDFECSGHPIPEIGEIDLNELGFTLEANKWYRIKASVTGDKYGDIKIKAFIDDMTTPVLEVTDDGSLWGTGSSCYEGNLPGYTVLSGYYGKNYYDNVQIYKISHEVIDADGDGYQSDTDCNDSNASIHPDAPEVCNEIDDNCDGDVDEGVINTYYKDADSDGYGNHSVAKGACSAPAGYVEDNTDCNDSDPDINPGATELCDGQDNDCNAATDDGFGEAWLGAACDGADSDLCQEGAYTCVDGSQTCSDNTGDDIEVCDNTDNDCDGTVDEDLTQATTCGAGACAGNTGIETCTAGAWVGDTCEPFFGATAESCDNTDNDCDGSVDEGFHADGDGVADCFDNCPQVDNSDQIDSDQDGVGDVCDNCPSDTNPGQSDIDEDGAGDLCDLCPADPLNECNSEGSTAEEIPADQGGTVETPDGDLALDIESGDLGIDTTISVTETVPQDPEVDLMVGQNPGLGQAIAVYDLEPDGLDFENPITLTVFADVSELNANQRNRLNLYVFTDTDGDLVEDSFVPIDPPANCTIAENPPNSGTLIATCTAEVDHFSNYAILTPLDSDDDGIPDLFGDEQDYCPTLSAEESLFIEYTGDLVLPVDETGFATLTVSAFLTDDDNANGQPVADVPVGFSCTDGNGYLYGECAGETDLSGNATCGEGEEVDLGPGVYTVGVVSDKTGCPTASTQDLLAVYDPSGGFVTGGGWIDSKAGAYVPDPSLAGKATFGFVSKYKKGATTPTGNTEFQFHAGDLNFHSSSYEWLVVTGSDYARFKGSGTINGMGDYEFMLWAGDGEPDTFRIKIWEEDEITATETITYDNDFDQEIERGSIKVHTN